MAEVHASTSGVTRECKRKKHLKGREQTVSVNCVVLLGSALSCFSGFFCSLQPDSEFCHITVSSDVAVQFHSNFKLA